MKVEVLHVPGCPSVALLLSRLAEVLGDLTTVSIRVVRTAEEAAALGLAGSPTLLVNGVDPFARPGQGVNLSCRLDREAPTVAQLAALLARTDDQRM
jgi:hypothetical protein